MQTSQLYRRDTREKKDMKLAILISLAVTVAASASSPVDLYVDLVREVPLWASNGVDVNDAQAIVVEKPRDGDVWTAGSIHEIRWRSYIYGATGDILFSKDSGSNWQTIKSSAANTGSYMWHLPDIVDSNQCLIKVAPSIPDTNVICVASGLFTIHPDSPNPVVQSQWESLGGDFKRTGLSENSGPQFGCVKWRFQTDAAVSTSITVGVDNTVHIACEDGQLYTLDANGALIWSYDTNSPLLSSPTIGPDGTVYVGGQNGKLYAIDIRGHLRWTHTTGGPIYSSAAVSADGKVYACSQDGIIYALAPDGSELWSFETNGPAQLSGSIFASPAIAADGTVYIAALYDPNLYALEPNEGSLKWACKFDSEGWPFTSPVIAADGTIYQTLLYDTSLYAIEPNGGSIIWSTDLADPGSGWFGPDYADEYGDADCWSEPALGPDGTIYVSFDDPYLRAVDPNGAIKWINQFGETGGFTLTVSSDGLIYAASDDGYLRVVNANGQEIARFQTEDWLNFPVVAADNMVIVSDAKDDSMLIADTNNTVWAIIQRPQDLNGDSNVNFTDVALLAANWLDCLHILPAEAYLLGDIDRNLCVDLADLAAIVEQWLGCLGLPRMLKLPPGPASNPNPADGAIDVSIYADLSWTAGSYATSHYVYFGSKSPATFRGNQTATTFDPGTMTGGITYYWRIDEVNPSGTTVGPVWRFTTGGGPRPR